MAVVERETNDQLRARALHYAKAFDHAAGMAKRRPEATGEFFMQHFRECAERERVLADLLLDPLFDIHSPAL